MYLLILSLRKPKELFFPPQFSSVAQLCPSLCDLWTAGRQASLSLTNSQSLLKLMSTESEMPSNHLILCRPLLSNTGLFFHHRYEETETPRDLLTNAKANTVEIYSTQWDLLTNTNTVIKDQRQDLKFFLFLIPNPILSS